MIKSKEKRKFYIEQFILNNIDNFQDWSNDILKDILKDNAILGYLFSTRESTLMCAEPKVLNLYLINRKYYQGTEITLKSLFQAWELFLYKCNTETVYKNKIVFVNPPIKEFIDTKDNWCKKLATKLSVTYHKSFEEALSDVYYGIMKCYTKDNIYIGNLSYIEKTINSILLMEIRSNKNKINQDSGLAISLNQTITESSDGEELALIDMLIGEDYAKLEQDYDSLKAKAIKLLSKSFSNREIDQILNTKQSLLPRSLYRKLWNWRKQHTEAEIYEQKDC